MGGVSCCRLLRHRQASSTQPLSNRLEGSCNGKGVIAAEQTAVTFGLHCCWGGKSATQAKRRLLKGRLVHLHQQHCCFSCTLHVWSHRGAMGVLLSLCCAFRLLARICFYWAGGQTQPIALSNQWVPCHGGFVNDGCCLGLITLPETAASV